MILAILFENYLKQKKSSKITIEFISPTKLKMSWLNKIINYEKHNEWKRMCVSVRVIKTQQNWTELNWQKILQIGKRLRVQLLMLFQTRTFSIWRALKWHTVASTLMSYSTGCQCPSGKINDVKTTCPNRWGSYSLQLLNSTQSTSFIFHFCFIFTFVVTTNRDREKERERKKEREKQNKRVNEKYFFCLKENFQLLLSS